MNKFPPRFGGVSFLGAWLSGASLRQPCDFGTIVQFAQFFNRMFVQYSGIAIPKTCGIMNTESEREVTTMINIRTIKKLENNGGLTLKKGKIVTYKSGWQVATEGKETSDPREAMRMIKAYGGNCGIWYSEGIYYIDLSHRVSTKKQALEIGRACNQQSILRWKGMKLVWC